MALQPKRGITGLKRGVHGGPDHAELTMLGLRPDDIIDFSVCTNPFMPPPGIREMLVDIPFERYPDSASSGFRKVLAGNLGIPEDNILAGNGTTEIIRLVAAAYLRRGESVLILEPTYGEYETTARIAGARPVKYRAPEDRDFVPDMKEVTGLIEKHRPRAVFLCNPNNPTGRYLPRRDVEAVIGAASGESLIVIDEAYIDFTGNRWDSLDLIKHDNVIVLRSMTKAWGIPGLRLGYTVACRGIIETLYKICPPWNVNAAAQEAGKAVLKNGEYLAKSLAQLKESKEYLVKELKRLGFKALPSEANYFLAKVGNAAACRSALLGQGILVRDGTSFGLPAYIRLAARAMPDCQKLIAAFERLIKTEII